MLGHKRWWGLCLVSWNAVLGALNHLHWGCGTWSPDHRERPRTSPLLSKSWSPSHPKPRCVSTLDVWVHQHSDDSRPHLSSHPHFWASLYTLRGFPGGSDGKESASNVGDWGSIPGSGGCPGKGNGYPLHYSCLENCMDQRSLVGHISPWDCKELDTTERLWLYSKYWGNLLCSNRNCYLIT